MFAKCGLTFKGVALSEPCVGLFCLCVLCCAAPVRSLINTPLAYGDACLLSAGSGCM